MCPVENAERGTFPSKAKNSWFHLSGQQKPACDINPPATPNRHTNHLRNESVWLGQNRNSESWMIQSLELTRQPCKVFSRSFCCLDEHRFLNRRFSDSEPQEDNEALSPMEPAGFGITCRRGSLMIRDEYQQGKVTSNNKQIEQRCGVLFEAQGIATTLFHRKHESGFMSLFCGFVISVARISVERVCCSDFAELRYQSDRYSTIRHRIGFRALAVRHGGLNGYQGQ